jgi:hypothetical protein
MRSQSYNGQRLIYDIRRIKTDNIGGKADIARVGERADRPKTAMHFARLGMQAAV